MSLLNLMNWQTPCLFVVAIGALTTSAPVLAQETSGEDTTFAATPAVLNDSNLVHLARAVRFMEKGCLRLSGADGRLVSHLGAENEVSSTRGRLTLYEGAHPRVHLGIDASGGGQFHLKDRSGADKIELGVELDAGALQLRGSNNTPLLRLGASGSGVRNQGQIQVYGYRNNGIDLFVTPEGDGRIELRGGSLEPPAKSQLRAAIGAATVTGEFPAGQKRVSKSGYVATYGSQENMTALLGPRMLSSADPQGAGNLTLFNREGETTIQLNGQTGEIIGRTKSFAMVHPGNENVRIVYAALEGPEAAAYARGTAILENGRAVISLPEHFQLVASAENMTVHLTPRSTASRGLAVVSSSPAQIVVEELGGGRGSYKFDYWVCATRKGYENFQVIRDR
ncbi:MAG: hypothetical protein ONB48_18105 [candidate division KSB1 bacterium]|nr:hypothetical protein [candidate division KSB1 bacterium]MDZ7275807.1 hypothetical protein [candidate division KSB1 bacterium]MDZ7287558.1 hypothetical protein [candidate division KSB1 bacterium]MDZ7308038.1 hypothetical protein [candidate division KSB1 bacterium]MDZ7350536.1 hypothetical protein [candidate division KSB1 bacterium]